MNTARADGLIVQPFPKPTPRITLAYRDLAQAAMTVADDPTRLTGFADLPRPWIPASCESAELRDEVWHWLDRVATWLNHEYVFDPIHAVPACWPEHPHLTHELACLADQRHRAGQALTSDLLEHWHRYALPAFIERMRHRIGETCEAGHPSNWPSGARFARYTGAPASRNRENLFAVDVGFVGLREPTDSRRLHVVDDPTRDP